MQEMAELQQSRRAQGTAAVTRTGTGPRERTMQQARRQEGWSWPSSPGSAPCKPPPKAKPFSFIFLAAAGSCSAPCPAPARWGQTSHSMQRPGGASPHRPRSKRRAHGIPERGPTHASASYLGPRAAMAPSPRASPRHLRGSARHPTGPHSRTPTLSSCAVFLPAPSSSCHLGTHSLPARWHGHSSRARCLPGTSLSRSLLPWHGAHAPGPSCRGRALPWPRRHPTSEDAAVQVFTAMPVPFRGSTASLGQAGTERRASAPVYTVNSRYYSNNFPCMIDFFLPGFVLDSPSKTSLLRTGHPQYYL